jgi:RNA polymerase sigma-70 factor (ECF subfamily)
MGESQRTEGGRVLTYCLVPRELAAKLHEPLREHFGDDPSVEVVVERRGRERRAADERRGDSAAADGAVDRRRVRNATGRRVGDRRMPLVAVDTPAELPRKARRFAAELVFVERLEPAGEELEDLDTARLVTRFQAGDGDVFTHLYLRYFDRVFSYLRVVFRDDLHEAEDLTQQVFTKVFEALPRYERRAQPFRAWLFVIVRNVALAQLKKRDRVELLEPEAAGRQREIEGEADPGVEALNWITDRELVMFVERLPEAQQQVLVLRFMLGLRASEIADVLGRSPNDVSQLQSRALRFLRHRLEAVGRHGTGGGPVRIRRRVLQAWVLRARRYALH